MHNAQAKQWLGLVLVLFILMWVIVTKLGTTESTTGLVVANVNDKITNTFRIAFGANDQKCADEVNKRIDILKQRIDTAEIVNYKRFDNKEDALEYIENLKHPILDTIKGAKQDLEQDIDGRIFIEIVRVELDLVQPGATKKIGAVYPVICVNGNIMQGSEHTLNNI